MHFENVPWLYIGEQSSNLVLPIKSGKIPGKLKKFKCVTRVPTREILLKLKIIFLVGKRIEAKNTWYFQEKIYQKRKMKLSKGFICEYFLKHFYGDSIVLIL